MAELVAALRRAGRRRQVDARAAAIQAALAGQQLEAPPVVAAAYGQVVAAAVAVIASLSEQLAALEAALTSAFGAHRDAGIVRSQPGLGVVLAARVLAEFGDDPDRYVSAKARKAYAGTAPITRASGLRQVVLARAVGNRRLSTACHLWAFAALTGSPGARRYYDAHRARGATHHQALRALANRLVGILHGCLRHRQAYDEQLAWPTAPAARPPERAGGSGGGGHPPGLLAILLVRGRWCRWGRHAVRQGSVADRSRSDAWWVDALPGTRQPCCLSHRQPMIDQHREEDVMDREQFWALIEAAKTATGGDCRAQTAQLIAALGERSVDEVLAWDRIHVELSVESYRRDLWGAAYLINGGCSDDGFDYFRGWLLGQGQAIWEAALARSGLAG